MTYAGATVWSGSGWNSWYNSPLTNATGKYTAPASKKSCTLTATSKADSTKTAKATVTISNASWTPAFSVARPGSWWVEITAKDTGVVSLSMRWPGGSSSPVPFYYKQAGTNFPIFAAALGFPDAGGSYVFAVQASNNRKASETLTIPACVHSADGVCH